MKISFSLSGGFLASMLVAGCAGHTPPLQVIDVHAIGAVQTEIKRQVGVYLAAAKAGPRVDVNGVMVPISQIDPKHRTFMCGAGAIGFDISSIKAELTTTTDTTTDLKAGLSIPVDIVTLGPSGEAKREALDTETLDYNLWPLPESRQNPDVYTQGISDEDVRNAPIARALRDLRDALISGALMYDLSGPTPQQRRPTACFTDYNPDKPSGDTGDIYKLGLSITNDVSGGISIKVAILTFGATGEAKSTTGNTLTVSFLQSGVQTLQALKDAADAECKHPNELASGCKKAKDALLDAEKNQGVGLRW